jgi:hypothetical protein
MKRKNDVREPKAATCKPETPKSRRLDVLLPDGVTMDKAAADLATAGLVANAGLVVAYSQAQHGELSLTDLVASLREAGKAVNGNNLSGGEQMLNAQAIALNSIFAELARRSAAHLGHQIDGTERYMRLALKAQSQCRTTLETLAAIKNPPVVYAKQANIANGPQQVNNGLPSQTSVQAGNSFQQTKLLEASHGGTHLDTGAARTAATSNHALEAMGAINRPAKS